MRASGFLIALFFTSLSYAQNSVDDQNQHPRQNEAVEVATNWLDLLEQNEFSQSYDLFAEIFKSMTSASSWESDLEQERETLGELISRELRRVVMYQDPQNATLPGVYAAVEFDSVYEHARRHFQYVMLHSQDGEPFKVMRREVQQLLNSTSPASDGAQ